MKRIILEVDDKLKAEFKSAVYSNYSTIKNVLKDFMAEYVAKNNKKPSKKYR